MKTDDHPLMRLVANAPHKLPEFLQQACAVLSERERTILEMRFGLKDGQSYSLEKVGEHFGVSGERIRQIEARALQKLNYPSRPRRAKRKLKRPVNFKSPFPEPA